MSGPAGTGKSRGGIEKLNFCALQFPEFRGLMVRKVRRSLNESGLETYETHVLGLKNPIIRGLQRRMRERYDYPNGSAIIVVGMDKAELILSTEFDLIFVQEATELEEKDWEFLLTRLRAGHIGFHQIISDANPGRPSHWLKQRCNTGLCEFYDTTHRDNPKMWDLKANDWTPYGMEYLSMLGRLSGIRKERLLKGKWIQTEGVVYTEYDPAVHIIDPFPIPKNWLRFRSIDFGFTNPFVCQWWAVDDDGRIYLYREWYKTQTTITAHAEKIIELTGDERIDFTVCDTDAGDAAVLAEWGIPNSPAEKDVSVGIQAVQDRFKIQGDGKPRIYLFRDALVEEDWSLEVHKKPTSTLIEIDSYTWKEDSNKEEPLKLYDHGMDAMRYATMAINEAILPLVLFGV